MFWDWALLYRVVAAPCSVVRSTPPVMFFFPLAQYFPDHMVEKSVFCKLSPQLSSGLWRHWTCSCLEPAASFDHSALPMQQLLKEKKSYCTWPPRAPSNGSSRDLYIYYNNSNMEEQACKNVKISLKSCKVTTTMATLNIHWLKIHRIFSLSSWAPGSCFFIF